MSRAGTRRPGRDVQGVVSGIRRTAAWTLAAGLLLAACAEEAGPGSAPPAPPPDSPVETVPPPGGSPAPEPTPMPVTPRPGELVDVRPVPWVEAEEVRPGTLLVTFWSGVEDCYGLDRVEVEEAPEAVTVTLFEGRVPGPRVCIEIALLKGVEVALDAPLGDRPLRDGAAK